VLHLSGVLGVLVDGGVGEMAEEVEILKNETDFLPEPVYVADLGG
jgi:hypothetical protein